MEITNVPLTEPFSSIDIYHSRSTVPLPGVVIAPGGSYQQIKERDSERVAITMASHAFQAAVVRYPVLEHRDYPAAKRALTSAFDYLNDHAAALDLDPRRLGVLGFSAGGQLAAAYSCQQGSRAHFAALGYPVIRPTLDQRMGVATEDVAKLVKPHTPPTFVWGSIKDGLTPYLDHVAVYAQALAENAVPFELHEFSTGGHGIALANRYTGVVNRDRTDKHMSRWFPLFLEWLRTIEMVK